MDTQTDLIGIEFFRREGNICEVVYDGQYLPDRAHTITAQIEAYVKHYDCQNGVLLDVSANPMLSVVRLTSLIEMLGTLRIPLAVIFGRRHQQELANLLHYTFIKCDHVGYFTTIEDAYAFLQATAMPPATR